MAEQMSVLYSPLLPLIIMLIFVRNACKVKYYCIIAKLNPIMGGYFQLIVILGKVTVVMTQSISKMYTLSFILGEVIHRLIRITLVYSLLCFPAKLPALRQLTITF